MMEGATQFYDREALLYRLHEGLEGSSKEVVFIVGAPNTAPFGGCPGVADVLGVIGLIRAEFEGKKGQLAKLDNALSNSPNKYQAAFDFLAGRLGQDAANRIIRKAVAGALVHTSSDKSLNLTEEQLSSLDHNDSSWYLPPAVDALGELIADQSALFGKIVITSNFDPLIEVAIRRHGGNCWRTSLSNDGSLTQSNAPGCQVVHIHGYWHGGDTLHTSRQLIQSRPTLKNDLLRLLHDKLVVVVGYGGWADIFTNALSGVVSDDNLFPEVLWTFFDSSPLIPDTLYATLKPGIDRGRVSLYQDINCHEFFPELSARWKGAAHSSIQNGTKLLTRGEGNARRARIFRLAPLECDRPPNVDVWVGRESELRALETSHAKVVVICGMGGEGKSVLASRYISGLGDAELRYARWDWRDCKEQSDRIRTQIIEVIVRFSSGALSAEDLKEANDEELVEILLDQIQDASAVLVFDNVDSYVDLENKIFIGLLDRLVTKMSSSNSSSRIVITCRPEIKYSSSSIISFPVKGISDDEAIDLFGQRVPNADIPEDDIKSARELTKGHAFWLDLLALQVLRVPGTTLDKLLQDLRRGREGGPDVLSSIWDKLALRERVLLRFMAETVRPETEDMIQRFVSSQLNYKNFSRALRSLISMNLIVVKPESNAPDLYDLHPLVRQFVRIRYEKNERASFIRVVINQYEQIIGNIESILGINLPFSMLERWSQKAELEISAGYYNKAFETLEKVEDALIGGGHSEEYIRVSRLLFESIDWETAPNNYPEFDDTVGLTVEAFNHREDYASADSLIERYEATIPQKTARYIKLCDIKAYTFWLRQDFGSAIDWASRGVSLKKETNVDTKFDCQHTLALAQRDNGDPEGALEYFRGAWEVRDFIEGKAELPQNGAIYGNVGRCLQMMGDRAGALACYRRSTGFLEKDATSHSKSNRAYARRWIGQVLAEQGDFETAEAFFLDGIRLLGASAPFRVKQMTDDLEGFRPQASQLMSEFEATRIVNRWMRA